MPVHGKNSKLYGNGVDLSPYLTKVEATADVDAAETSTFGATGKTYIPGNPNGVMQAEGRFDGSPLAIADRLASLFGTDNSVWLWLPGGDSAPSGAQLLFGHHTAYSVMGDVGDVVGASFGAQSDLGWIQGYVLHARAAETATGTSAWVDTEAGLAVPPGTTALGAESHLQVLALAPNGGTLTVALQGSTDGAGAGLVTLATHTVVTAAGAAGTFGTPPTPPAWERLAVAAGVNVPRYFRSSWTLAGGATSATFIHAGGRR